MIWPPTTSQHNFPFPLYIIGSCSLKQSLYFLSFVSSLIPFPPSRMLLLLLFFLFQLNPSNLYWVFATCLRIVPTTVVPKMRIIILSLKDLIDLHRRIGKLKLTYYFLYKVFLIFKFKLIFLLSICFFFLITLTRTFQIECMDVLNINYFICPILL